MFRREVFKSLVGSLPYLHAGAQKGSPFAPGGASIEPVDEVWFKQQVEPFVELGLSMDTNKNPFPGPSGQSSPMRSRSPGTQIFVDAPTDLSVRALVTDYIRPAFIYSLVEQLPGH